MDLQASLAILIAASNKPFEEPQPDPHGRLPFQHPALESVESLTEESKSMVLDTERMFILAKTYGLPDVVRWKPKNVSCVDFMIAGESCC